MEEKKTDEIKTENNRIAMDGETCYPDEKAECKKKALRSLEQKGQKNRKKDK